MITKTYAETQSIARPPMTPGTAPRKTKQCLLIVFGAPERLQALRDVLQGAGADIICCGSLAEVGLIAAHQYDLVVVDVAPTEIVKVLRIVRNREIEASIPVLVEDGRLRAEPQLAGVLSLFRAMPCGFPELLKLARHLLAPGLSYRSNHFGNSHHAL